MVEAAGSLPPTSTKYWVDVILTTAWECRRFDCERKALAFAQVYARFPKLKRSWLTPTHRKGGRSSSRAKQNEAGAKHGNSAEQRATNMMPPEQHERPRTEATLRASPPRSKRAYGS
jgi:hypothetical protein